MLRSGMTVTDATREWVREFNAIPAAMVGKLMGLDPDDWYEVTEPCPGDRVYVFSYAMECDEGGGPGEVIDYDEESGLYAVRLDNGPLLSLEECDFDVERDDVLPMWGTMWSFGEILDEDWLEEGGIGLMSRCGFRVYRSEEFGYFFGIDGAGYDFFESHWVPLYRARGLQWHDPETERKVS